MSRQPDFGWCIGLGQWCGATIWIHLLLPLLCMASLTATLFTPWRPHGLVLVGVLLTSLALRELARLVAARQLGGGMPVVVVGPIGSLTTPQLPELPEPRLFVAMMGPMVHLALVVFATAVLVQQQAAEVLPLLQPLNMAPLFNTALPIVELTFKVTLWLNWSLCLLHLLPAYPFDGAVALRALLWPMVGQRSANIWTWRVAMGVALLLTLGGLYGGSHGETIRFAWGVPLMLALVVAVSGRSDRLLGDPFRIDLQSRYLLPEELPSPPQPLSTSDARQMVLVEQHYDQLRERYERRRQAQEDYEDARVDDILARLYHDGMEHLSPEDQAFLERASQRYRERRSKGSTQA